jgi:hypothetical protein
MKITAHVSLAFKELSFSNKVTFGNAVITALSSTDEQGEPIINLFPNLPVPLDELQRINDKVFKDLAESETGLHTAKLSLRASVRVWNDAFGATAKYVNFIAQGNVILMSLAGFRSTKSERSPKSKPQSPVTLSATVGSSRNSVNAGIKKAVDGAKAYVFAAAPDGVNISYNGNSMIIEFEGKQVFINAVTKKKTTFHQMPSLVAYNVSVYAINNAGMGAARDGGHVVAQ